MKKLMYIPLVLLTSVAYATQDKNMTFEDQAELRTVLAALAECRANKEKLAQQHQDSNHHVDSTSSVPNHFKMRKDPNSSYFIPSSILNHSCELLAQRYTEITLRSYGPMRISPRPHHIDRGIK